MKPIATCLLAMALVCAPAPAASDERALIALIEGLCNRSVSPEQALDPQMKASERSRNLAYFADASRILSIERKGAFEFPSNDTAAALAAVSLKTTHSTTRLEGVELLFVKRNAAWYFADFSFVDSTGWYVFLLLLALAVAGLSAIALLRRRAARITQ
jgi:hypothetical protein